MQKEKFVSSLMTLRVKLKLGRHKCGPPALPLTTTFLVRCKSTEITMKVRPMIALYVICLCTQAQTLSHRRALLCRKRSSILLTADIQYEEQAKWSLLPNTSGLVMTLLAYWLAVVYVSISIHHRTFKLGLSPVPSLLRWQVRL